jgi:hypothetical protein
MASQHPPSGITAPVRCGGPPRAHRAWRSARPPPSGPQGRRGGQSGAPSAAGYQQPGRGRGRNAGVPTICRIIVGANGSPGSLRALRYAQHLARDFDATLVPVLAWLPPCGDLADRRTPNEELRRIWAHARLPPRRPAGGSGRPPGRPGPDRRRPGEPLLPRPRRVSGPGRSAAPLARQARHDVLARAFWHRTLTTDQISPDKRRAAETRHGHHHRLVHQPHRTGPSAHASEYTAAAAGPRRIGGDLISYRNGGKSCARWPTKSSEP